MIRPLIFKGIAREYYPCLTRIKRVAVTQFPMSQQLIDLTTDSQETQVIDLTAEEELPTLVNDDVTSILLTYPRILDQLERAGIELMDDGSLKYFEFDQLCHSGSIKDFFLNHLLQLDPQPAYIIVAQEAHQDGTPHIHCFVQWIRKSSFRNDYFDFHGMHPNILNINNPVGGKRYCTKYDRSYLKWVKCIFIDDEDEGFFPEALPPYQEE